jgi:hypothetical protein
MRRRGQQNTRHTHAHHGPLPSPPHIEPAAWLVFATPHGTGCGRTGGGGQDLDVLERRVRALRQLHVRLRTPHARATVSGGGAVAKGRQRQSQQGARRRRTVRLAGWLAGSGRRALVEEMALTTASLAAQRPAYVEAGSAEATA